MRLISLVYFILTVKQTRANSMPTLTLSRNCRTIYRMKLNRLIEARQGIRRRINSQKKYDRFLHNYISVVLLIYAMLAITLTMALSGIGIIDSLPIALYILPLMVFLPLMILAYYRDRSAAWNFVFLIICSVFFGMLSLLIHGFLFCLVLNIIAGAAIFLLGRFRPKSSLKQVGKKGLAYIILLNLLGLTFPVSVVVMGELPIAISTVNSPPLIALGVPLSDFDYPYQNLTPTAQLLSNISSNSFNLDFRILEDDAVSWLRLRNWIEVLNETTIQYSVTLTPNRSALIDEPIQTLATTKLIEALYHSHRDALSYLMNITMSGITNTPQNIVFDMILSRQEWQMLMLETRSIDLIGFSSLMRTSIFSVDLNRIEYEATLLYSEANAAGIDSGVLVEPFVIDDMQDGDSYAMRVCGATCETLGFWTSPAVLCDRSRFSFEMQGDIGEYLVHSYSRSIAQLGTQWSMRLGNIGNSTDVLSRIDTVYNSIEVLVNDIALAAGNGIHVLVLDSLPSLLSTFGSDALSKLRNTIDATIEGLATYTFRLYAFRAVFMAIDAFDLLML
jgi:hypothetical protein